MPRSRSVAALLLALASCALGAAEPWPQGDYAKNVSMVGYNNLDDKPAFKMSVVRSGDRWYLYIGHFWVSGWTILDMSDPVNGKVVKFIPGPKGSFTGQMDIHGNTMITGLQKPVVPGVGVDPDSAFAGTNETPGRPTHPEA